MDCSKCPSAMLSAKRLLFNPDGRLWHFSSFLLPLSGKAKLSDIILNTLQSQLGTENTAKNL